jgi:hypothetical protein
MMERLLASQEKANAKIEALLERMETAMHSMRSDIAQTTKRRKKDVLSSVDQKTQPPHGAD